MNIRLFTAVALALVGTSASARQFCCRTNPNICINACGLQCCGVERFAANAPAPNLTRIPTADLAAELDAATDADGDFKRVLRAEINKRRNIEASRPTR